MHSQIILFKLVYLSWVMKIRVEMKWLDPTRICPLTPFNFKTSSFLFITKKKAVALQLIGINVLFHEEALICVSLSFVTNTNNCQLLTYRCPSLLLEDFVPGDLLIFLSLSGVWFFLHNFVTLAKIPSLLFLWRLFFPLSLGLSNELHESPLTRLKNPNLLYCLGRTSSFSKFSCSVLHIGVGT